MLKEYISRIPSEILKTIKNPLRLANIFDKRKLYAWRMSIYPENQLEWKKSSWKRQENQNFDKREYQSYEDYVRHQRSKLTGMLLTGENEWLERYDQRYYEVLKERLTAHIHTKGLSVLCLAARIGTEVRSFIDLGCFAIGLDLNPGKENKYVVCGDFHYIQYADESVDIVFTNSFDHALKPEQIISEARRVLKPNGRFFLEVALGSKEGESAGDYEAFHWDTIDDVIPLFEKQSFKFIHSETIRKPFHGGKFIIFEKISE